MRQPDVDPRGLSDAPERRRRRRLPYVVVGVVLVALVLFVWLHDRQAAHWENAEYGISLEFQNRFNNLASDEDPDRLSTGMLFSNGFLVRNNPGWDEHRMRYNGFSVIVMEPPAEFVGLTADELAGQITVEPTIGVLKTSEPVELATVTGRRAVVFTSDYDVRGVLWRDQVWLVPVGDLWYEVVLRTRVADWQKEAPALTEAALSLRIAGDD